jgi:hypothetical protein
MVTLPPSEAVEQAYTQIGRLLAAYGDSQQITQALIAAYQAGQEVCRYEQEISK